MALTLILPTFRVDKEGRGIELHLPPPIALERLEIYKHDNWVNYRSHTEFQVNPMAPISKKCQFLTFFHGNLSNFSCSCNFLTRPVAFKS